MSILALNLPESEKSTYVNWYTPEGKDVETLASRVSTAAAIFRPAPSRDDPCLPFSPQAPSAHQPRRLAVRLACDRRVACVHQTNCLGKHGGPISESAIVSLLLIHDSRWGWRYASVEPAALLNRPAACQLLIDSLLTSRSQECKRIGPRSTLCSLFWSTLP